MDEIKLDRRSSNEMTKTKPSLAGVMSPITPNPLDQPCYTCIHYDLATNFSQNRPQTRTSPLEIHILLKEGVTKVDRFHAPASRVCAPTYGFLLPLELGAPKNCIQCKFPAAPSHGQQMKTRRIGSALNPGVDAAETRSFNSAARPDVLWKQNAQIHQFCVYVLFDTSAVQKWRSTGHMMRDKQGKWCKAVSEWYPRDGKRSRGRQCIKWEDDIKTTAGPRWRRVTQDRPQWKLLEEAYAKRHTESRYYRYYSEKRFKRRSRNSVDRIYKFLPTFPGYNQPVSEIRAFKKPARASRPLYQLWNLSECMKNSQTDIHLFMAKGAARSRGNRRRLSGALGAPEVVKCDSSSDAEGSCRRE
ncbi:hypothetical protein EVAR_18518_1 [Eumeta japonica]|uniref:Uncharacterized protein n=1 Tax=Eumeta variegata TaxID=151549 RepID=A0A4C1V0G7_EUMVA|nr:hypothetical protein EVAR_18518_1 [Eumeta japonica]